MRVLIQEKDRLVSLSDRAREAMRKEELTVNTKQ